ncbi:hypothetical protein PC123_g24293 [Phytophthora cactorum]|nr:hypothetical protein PC123_g24293 [Phytophthora cactorum]
MARMMLRYERNRLSPLTLEMILFLKVNQKYWDVTTVDGLHPSSHYLRVSRQSYSAQLGVITAVAYTTTKKVAGGDNTNL